MAEKFTAGEAEMVFTGKDADFQKTADRVEQSMGSVAKSMESGAEATEKFFVNVRGYTILTRVSSGLKAMGDEAVKMSLAMQEGKASAGDLFEKVAESIPIIGGFVSAGRDLRELFTGEKAYTEILKEQTALQEKRTAALHGFVEAMKELQRAQDDLTKGLTTKRGPEFDITGIFTGGERQAEDLSDKTKARFKRQFDDIAEERKRLGQKLQDLQSQNHETRVSQGGKGPLGSGGGPDIIVPVPAEVTAGIAALDKQLKALDDQAQKLRDAQKRVEDLQRESIAHGVFKQTAEIVGGVVVKAFDAAAESVERYLGHSHEMTETTIRAFKEAGGAALEYQNILAGLDQDLERGLISIEDFNNLKLDQFTRNAVDNLTEYIDTTKSAEEITTEFLERWAAVDPKIPKFTEFRASFVGLSDLNSRIQAGAGSGEAGTIDKQQLDAQKEIAKHSEAAKTAIDELKAEFMKRSFPAAVR